MDEMETLNAEGQEFLCSAEQLPSGLFQAVVRHRVPPDGQIRTLVLGQEQHGTARAALEQAKTLALQWANKQRGKKDSNA